jgi:5-amino-6-(5-phosphoribosylamino)uracil reductase
VPARPYTILSCAISLDGYLDDASPDRLILSGPEDLDDVGAGTIRADNPRLLVRDPARVAARAAAGRPPHPLRVTITATGDLDPAARFFTGPGTPLVYAATTAAATAREKLGDKAVIVEAGPVPSLARVLENLYTERSVFNLLAEPGARMARDLLAAGLADELRLAIAPFIIGAESAPRFAMPARYPHGPAAPMALVDVRRLGDLVVLRYRLDSDQRY